MRNRNEVVDRLESELVAKNRIIESVRSDLAVRDAIIGEQERELHIFRTSKLQRLRTALLHEKSSSRQLIRIAYLVASLATPQPPGRD